MNVRVQLLARTMYGTKITIERKFEERNEENGVIVQN